MNDTPILNAQKELRDLYGVCQTTGRMDEQSFVSLRQAIHIAKFTGSDTATLKSIQGYAINDEQTIYISSERAPEFKKGKLIRGNSSSIIFRMRWNHDSTQRQYYLDLLPLDTNFFKQIGTMGKNVLVLGELEDLQYLKDGSIMLAVTWHVLKNDPSIVNQPDFQITNDYINLNQIDDRVDLYQVKLN